MMERKPLFDIASPSTMAAMYIAALSSVGRDARPDWRISPLPHILTPVILGQGSCGDTAVIEVVHGVGRRHDPCQNYAVAESSCAKRNCAISDQRREPRNSSGGCTARHLASNTPIRHPPSLSWKYLQPIWTTDTHFHCATLLTFPCCLSTSYPQSTGIDVHSNGSVVFPCHRRLSCAGHWCLWRRWIRCCQRVSQ
jgi:hypothetical protein